MLNLSFASSSSYSHLFSFLNILPLVSHACIYIYAMVFFILAYICMHPLCALHSKFTIINYSVYFFLSPIGFENKGQEKGNFNENGAFSLKLN